MNRVALLIGGNQSLRRGATSLSRRALIEQATVLIQERIGTVVALSQVYETEPWGDFESEGEEGEVQNFMNRALLVETPLDPHATLREALEIEKELGRERPSQDTEHTTSNTKVYRSRPMDIDLIFFNDDIIDTEDLTIPHPRMHLRRFVLEPMTEIMADYRHPVLGQTVGQLLDTLN